MQMLCAGRSKYIRQVKLKSLLPCVLMYPQDLFEVSEGPDEGARHGLKCRKLRICKK